MKEKMRQPTTLQRGLAERAGAQKGGLGTNAEESEEPVIYRRVEST